MDVSPDMLDRVQIAARVGGLANRVQTVQSDLDEAWPALPPVDLVWAAASLHELARPGGVLARAFSTMTPGGLLVVTEMDAPPRFLPHDLGIGEPGLEERIHGSLSRAQFDRDLHPDWTPLIAAAGFELVQQQTYAIELPSPQSPTVGRYARSYLRRVRPALVGRLVPADLATLDALLADQGADSLLERHDVGVRGTRSAWAARRG